MAKVKIPSLMRDITEGVETVEVVGHTVGECLDNLDILYPGIRSRLCSGKDLIPVLNVAVDGKITPRRLKARVHNDSDILFIPAIAGG